MKERRVRVISIPGSQRDGPGGAENVLTSGVTLCWADMLGSFQY